ncbi:SMI1/KNR4 family protein [Pseudomonas sp. B21-056]|jgi:hypothetical protein|uniref:SMI1/KNR4 family protein n=1 Tax=Pseudomonas sp. B21-056 TaxID=2895495 RepID=UPI0022310DA5|nr:SMI1/KNR4 family protein [Pseudomonas sp. B21-056]UZE26162.1 SMI1/KNR4 family protein [Pseudomonas sp. B21-056]
MNISNIKGIVLAGGAVSNTQLVELQSKLNVQLPRAYVQLLETANGFSLRNGLVIYSSDELVERNDTLEVEKYAPGYLVIGDDSGGRSIVVSYTDESVFLVDQGSMDPDDFEKISLSLSEWVSGGCAF